MLRLTLRALRARPMRLAMSALSVMLSVAFLAGVLVFSHGLRSTFADITQGSTPDAVVRAAAGSSSTGQPGTTLDAGLAKRLAALPEVARADGQVQALGTTLLGADGTAVGSGGAPTVTESHDGAPNMHGGQPLVLLSGTWPTIDDEVVLDRASARSGGYHVGDEVRILTPVRDAPVRLRLTGTAEFNGGGTAGATLVVLSTHGAQRVFLQGRDVYTRIALTAARGVSQRRLADAAGTLLPAGYEAVTGDHVAQESEDVIGSFLDAISAFLLIFAIIAVVVATFIIINTFTILVAQRTRELALLRALGATRRQVRRSVLAEAVLVGLVASTVGIGLGWALAHVLAAGFGLLGLHMESSALTLTGRTVVTGYVVGVGVTLLASYLPARRAGRLAPLAALRREEVAATGPSWIRTGIGGLLVLLGLAFAGLGLADIHPRPGSPWILVGVAGLFWILGAAALMPLLGRPLLALLRWPYRALGVTGRLAVENARQDARRTGATASALMIGLALVSTIAVLAASLDATIGDTIDSHFTSDFRVHGNGATGFPTAVGDRMARVRGVAAVARQQQVPGLYAGGWVVVTGIDDHYAATHHVDLVAGSSAVRGGSAIVSRSFARAHALDVGSPLTIGVGTATVTARVGGIISSSSVSTQLLVPLQTLATAGVPRHDTALSILMTPGADQATVRAGLERAAASTPYVSVDDKQEFSDQLHQRVDKLIYLIYGLLALAVVIAVLGIVNTLGLSVLERRRELGLLRAVGTTRAQVRRMVVLESVAIALLGAAVGLVLGVLIGVLLQHALRSDLTSLAIPAAGLFGFLVAAVLIGVLAAVVPSIRAARMRPLAAAGE